MSNVKVTITDERGSTSTVGSGSAVPSLDQGEKGGPIPTVEAKQSRNGILATAAATMAVQQTINYMTSNVGKWSGSSYQQSLINQGIQAVGLLAVAGSNPFAAAAIVAVQVGTQAADYAYERKWDSKRSKQDLARLGYSSQGEMLGRKR